MPRLAIFGVTGRMGQSLLRALPERHELELSGALASPGSPRLGADAAAEGAPTGIVITADAGDALRGADVAMDFSTAAASVGHAQACARAGVPLLVGTTGFDAAARAALTEVSRRIPLLLAPNTSLGVAVLNRLVALATEALGPGYEVEILEAHHRGKRDAPSGTALALGETVAAVRGQPFDRAAARDRLAGGPRTEGSIGFAVVRAGDIIGEHTVILAGEGERLELTHRATDRMTFARGALAAAAWLASRPPGLYGMKDVLGIG